MIMEPFSMAMIPFSSNASKILLFLVQVTYWMGGLALM